MNIIFKYCTIQIYQTYTFLKLKLKLVQRQSHWCSCNASSRHAGSAATGAAVSETAATGAAATGTAARVCKVLRVLLKK
jgi:hypothetical protein